MPRRLCCIFLALACLLLQTGCFASKKGQTLRFDIPQGVQSLDPQFTSQPTAQTLLANCMEGLVRRLPDGSLRTAAAESYRISPDGLTYTFFLAEATWSDGSPLAAQDFAFALRRLFMPGALSPYAANFTAIAGAREVLAGNLPPQELGITVPNASTLVITLETPDPFFLQALASSAALPCNEKFFYETKGRYGMTEEHLLTNGPYSLLQWDNTKSIVLAKDSTYHKANPLAADMVVFYVARSNPVDLLLSGKSDAGPIPFASLSEARRKGFVLSSYSTTTWALVFPCSGTTFSSQDLRAAIAQGTQRSQLTANLAENLQPGAGLLPPSALLGERPYRQLAGAPFEPSYDPYAAKELYTNALSNIGLTTLNGCRLVVPDTPSALAMASSLQQMWQANLGFYINIESISLESAQQGYTPQSKDIALLPLTLPSSQAHSLLARFTAGNPQNPAGFADPAFDAALAAAAASPRLEDIAAQLSAAEDILLQDGVVIPLYSETTYYAIAPSIKGVALSPFDGVLLIPEE